MRHVVIVGASSGIGASLAQCLAEKGTTLSLIGRDIARLSDVVENCRARGAEASGYIMDVCDGQRMHDFLLDLDTTLPVDILVANAGLGGAAAVASSSGERPADAREIATTNFVGVVNTLSPLLGAFVQRRRGAIVVVSSLVAGMHMPLAPVYGASKAGVSVYARNLQGLLRGTGVTVTLVLPGFVDTPMSRSLAGPRPGLVSADDAARYIINGIARKRATVAFPASVALATRLAFLLPDAVVGAIARLWAPRE